MAQPTEKQKQIEMCRLELRAILEKYNLELRGIPAFTEDGRVEVSIIFVKAPPKDQGQSGESSKRL